MCPVYKPEQSPPVLSRFFHLSADGQALMTAVYKQYYVEKQKPNDISQRKNFSCYQSLYFSKFGKQPIQRNNYSQQSSEDPAYCFKDEASQQPIRKQGIFSTFPSDARLNGSLEHLPSETKYANREKVKDKTESKFDTNYSFLDSVPIDIQFMNKEILCPSISEEPGDATCISESLDISASEGISDHEASVEMYTTKQFAPCSIQKRIAEHREIRKINSEERSEGETRTENEYRKRKNNQFFTPFKERKTSQTDTIHKKILSSESKSEFSSEEDMVIKNEIQHSVTDITCISNCQRKKIFEEMLTSCYALFTLIYTNGSTLLREESSISHKKRNFSIKIRNMEEVQSISIFYQKKDNSSSDFTQNKVITFPVCKSAGVSEQISEFWKNLLNQNQVTKICCFAKEALIVIMRKFMQCENMQDKTQFPSLMCCDILDPIVGCWLLDPDNTPTTFCQALEMLHIAQKDVDLLHAKDVVGEDFLLLRKLMDAVQIKLKAKGLWRLFCCVETKLIPLLANMELQKIRVDTDILMSFSNTLKRKLRKLEKMAHETAGHSFLLNSPAQLRQILFEEMKLGSKLQQKTKFAKTSAGHQTSTSESVLLQLINVHPLPAIILEYRQIQKLKSTYVDGMMSCMTSGCLSTHWDQTSAVTGRLASYQPNMQAVPKTSVTIKNVDDNFIVGKETKGSSIQIFAREPFMSHEGWTFLAADFQQIELRLLAHLANDSILLDIFRNPQHEDIFIQLTSQWLNKAASSVTLAEREQTKRVVYSVMYGVGKEKLAEYLKISTENAKGIMQSFLVTFPAVNQFTTKCKEFCQQFGYTESIFHRQRLFPNIHHPSPPMRAQAERQSVNFCVQGSAADLCKAAMLQVEQALSCNPHLKARLLVQIHDELLFEVANENLVEVKDIVQKVMENAQDLCGDVVQLRVPLKVSLSTGTSWGHMTPMLNYKSNGQKFPQTRN